jgi:hypothetical protein
MISSQTARSAFRSWSLIRHEGERIGLSTLDVGNSKRRQNEPEWPQKVKWQQQEDTLMQPSPVPRLLN